MYEYNVWNRVQSKNVKWKWKNKTCIEESLIRVRVDKGRLADGP